MSEQPNGNGVEYLTIQTPYGKYTATPAYLRGAQRAQEGKPAMNPYKPGPELAQYNYGFANEIAGYHDELDLPFHLIATESFNAFYRPGRK